MALRDLAARLVEAGLNLDAEFKLVFQEFVNPRPQGLDFGAGQARDGRLNFLNCTHDGKVADERQIEKSRFQPNRASFSRWIEEPGVTERPCRCRRQPHAGGVICTVTGARSKSLAAIRTWGLMPANRAMKRSGTVSSRVL